MGLGNSTLSGNSTSIFNELSQNIKREPGMTVFAPTNSTFTNFPAQFGIRASELSGYDEFQDILENHFAMNGVARGNIVAINDMSYEKDEHDVNGVPIIDSERRGGEMVYVINGLIVSDQQLKDLQSLVRTLKDDGLHDPTLEKTMGMMSQLCDRNGGYLYTDKNSQTSFTFEKGDVTDQVLWEADVTGGLRTTASYTNSLKKALEIVTIQDDVLPVGSFKYNIHKYPGDVDIFEHLSVCCCIDDAKRVAVRRIQDIVRKIRASDDIYLGDFKAGEDDRFSVDLGKWSNDTLLGYNERRIVSDVERLYQQDLLAESEFEQFKKYALPNPSEEEWQKLKDYAREFKVLRWSMDELARGFKVLPGNMRLSLGDALDQQTLVKIDMWAKINGKYLEVTNFFMINVVNRSGKRVYLLTQELPDYVVSMSNDVRFYSSPQHRKTLKAIKRLWSLAIFEGNLALAERLSPMFSTNGAALNQLEGEAEVLALMLEKLERPPLDDIMRQLDQFKPRIDQLSEFPERNQELYDLVDSITKPYFDNPSRFNRLEESIDGIQLVQKKIKNLVEDMIIVEARQRGLENPASLL